MSAVLAWLRLAVPQPSAPSQHKGPWKLATVSGRYCVQNLETGDVGSGSDGKPTTESSGSRCHDTRDGALNQLRAMYASSTPAYQKAHLQKSYREAKS